MKRYPSVGFGLISFDDSGREVVRLGSVVGDELVESVPFVGSVLI